MKKTLNVLEPDEFDAQRKMNRQSPISANSTDYFSNIDYAVTQTAPIENDKPKQAAKHGDRAKRIRALILSKPIGKQFTSHDLATELNYTTQSEIGSIQAILKEFKVAGFVRALALDYRDSNKKLRGAPPIVYERTNPQPINGSVVSVPVTVPAVNLTSGTTDLISVIETAISVKSDAITRLDNAILEEMAIEDEQKRIIQDATHRSQIAKDRIAELQSMRTRLDSSVSSTS